MMIGATAWRTTQTNGKAHAMRLRSVLWMSLLLGLTGCSAAPPCNRSDMTPAYRADGLIRPRTPLPFGVSRLPRN